MMCLSIKTTYLRILVTGFITLIANTSWLEAQEAKSAFVYGMKAGVNFAELYGQDALPESDRKVGYSLGGFTTYSASTSWKIQMELIWSLQGEKSATKGRYSIAYLNIPLLVKWTEGHWYSEAGVQLGLLTLNSSQSVPEEIRLKEFETFDFSLCAGIGYQLDDDWSIGVRYTQGLTDIVPNKDLKNSVIYLGIAYTIM